MYNILYLNDTGGMGGSERVLLRLVERLNKGIYRPVVVCGSSGPLVDALRARGAQVHILKVRELKTIEWRVGPWRVYHPLSLLWDMLYLLRATIKLWLFMRGKRFDIVHTNMIQSKLCGSVTAKLKRLRLIWHVHNIQPPGLRRGVVRWMANRFPDRIIAVSEAVKRVYDSSLKEPQKIRVIHNGIDLSAYKDPDSLRGKGIREEYGLDPQVPLVTMISLLRSWKGHELFLKSACEVKSREPNMKFLIVGDEPLAKDRGYREHLEELTQHLGISDDVIFTGFRDDIPRILHEIDLLVSASILPDPFPTVILEAMAAARPIVATAVGGVPEMVEDGVTGILVPPKDPQRMAEAILTLIKDREMARRMGQRGRERVRRLFSVERFAREVQDLYRELLEEGK